MTAPTDAGGRPTATALTSAHGDTTAAPGSEQSAAGVLTVEPGSPTQVGRFLLLDTLGRGGMGVVHAAYDPTLDRRIAVKLVQPRLDPAGSDGDRERLLR